MHPNIATIVLIVLALLLRLGDSLFVLQKGMVKKNEREQYSDSQRVLFAYGRLIINAIGGTCLGLGLSMLLKKTSNQPLYWFLAAITIFIVVFPQFDLHFRIREKIRNGYTLILKPSFLGALIYGITATGVLILAGI